jgi:hypothetical protein
LDEPPCPCLLFFRGRLLLDRDRDRCFGLFVR